MTRISAALDAPERSIPNSGIVRWDAISQSIDQIEDAKRMVRASTGIGQRSVQRALGSLFQQVARTGWLWQSMRNTTGIRTVMQAPNTPTPIMIAVIAPDDATLASPCWTMASSFI